MEQAMLYTRSLRWQRRAPFIETSARLVHTFVANGELVRSRLATGSIASWLACGPRARSRLCAFLLALACFLACLNLRHSLSASALSILPVSSQSLAAENTDNRIPAWQQPSSQ